MRTKLSEHKRYCAPTGNGMINTYQEEIDKKSGRQHLVKTGQTNTYEKTQADLEDTKIENIVHKLAMGDLSVFKEAHLTYADAEDFPQNLMEAQNIVVKAKAEFDKMPAEVREIFHNSPEEYVSQMGTEEFIKKLSPYNDEIAKKQKEAADLEFSTRVDENVKFQKAVNEKMTGGNN